MKLPTFTEQVEAWSNPPVDDIGYIAADELLAMKVKPFERTMEQMHENRYHGWRSHQGAWRRVLKLDATNGKRVLDYGCGVGVESLQYAPTNRVWIADISPKNLQVAARTFEVRGYEPAGVLLIDEKPPFLTPPETLDVIHCVGVLHHIPNPVPVVKAMHSWLSDYGELRLMLYSEVAWTVAVGTPPPQGKVEDDPGFEKFTRHWDGVGGYADWYDRRRLKDRFGEWFNVENVEPLTQKGEYIGAILGKR